jgi:hypothetical protein
MTYQSARIHRRNKYNSDVVHSVRATSDMHSGCYVYDIINQVDVTVQILVRLTQQFPNLFHLRTPWQPYLLTYLLTP